GCSRDWSSDVCSSDLLVQTMIPLGEFGGMKLTTAGYFTPSGRSIDKIGITPDVEAWNELDRQIAAALKARRELSDTRQTEETQWQQNQQENVPPPAAVPTPGQDGPDLVLQAAMEVLRAPPKPSARKYPENRRNRHPPRGGRHANVKKAGLCCRG